MSKFDKFYEIFHLTMFWAVGALWIMAHIHWFLVLEERKGEKEIWEIENCDWIYFSGIPTKKYHHDLFIDCRGVWK